MKIAELRGLWSPPEVARRVSGFAGVEIACKDLGQNALDAVSPNDGFSERVYLNTAAGAVFGEWGKKAAGVNFSFEVHPENRWKCSSPLTMTVGFDHMGGDRLNAVMARGLWCALIANQFQRSRGYWFPVALGIGLSLRCPKADIGITVYDSEGSMRVIVKVGENESPSYGLAPGSIDIAPLVHWGLDAIRAAEVNRLLEKIRETEERFNGLREVL